ncbi:PLP-dependent aminotransferase family protein [Acidithiobacillus thiooxidans]|uniref:MocR-like pyridoxine biosynthesis transcription factor PdxR n=1 Tax=Acidithiobacillus thiooxidans TaxID=930 RepID=UPI00286234B0|nr:PLP-dependent aminotransferase family protein [Acidithiobacillus thiooxidans]MDR7928842.1 PLP-dependent aminotransferase family protein [Acidithiobacillus thiooxidans]
MVKTKKSKLDIPYRIFWQQLLPDLRHESSTLQSQLRAAIIGAIFNGSLRPFVQLPSSRSLATILRVSRNTVLLTLEQLVLDGYLIAKPRSGYFVAARENTTPGLDLQSAKNVSQHALDWSGRVLNRLSTSKWLYKAPDWQQYRYPFVYGQFDPKAFPVAEWRECNRLSLSTGHIRKWASDAVEQDDDMLVEQLIRRVLPQRGIAAKPEQILLTVGAQQALFLVAEALVSPSMSIGFEDPGYMDARNIFLYKQARIVPLDINDQWMKVEMRLADCHYLYCTPSHQCPSGVTMSTDRRHQLLEMATLYDQVIIEDDYDAETQYQGLPLPALKAMDRNNRVIYIGSISKVISPALRIGYIVADEKLIDVLRYLRRLMIRHPATNNQRTLALYIAQGHYDKLIIRTQQALSTKAQCLSKALKKHLSGVEFQNPNGGSVVWARLPEGVDGRQLAVAALAKSVLIELGDPFFYHDDQDGHYIRFGFSSIELDRIETGISILASFV